MLKNTSNYSSYQKERLKNFSCNITLAFRNLYMYSFLHLLYTDSSKKSKSPYGFRICVRLPSISLHFLQILSFTKYRMAGVYLLVPIPRRGDFRWLIKWLSSWTSKVLQKIYWFVGIEHHVQKRHTCWNICWL